MSDLDKLIEAVEDGEALPMDGGAYRLFGDDWLHVFDAYHGYLDAAKALHDALLPAYRFRIEDCHVSVWYGHNGPFLALSEAYKSPARAWLLSILKAYRAQQKG